MMQGNKNIIVYPSLYYFEDFQEIKRRGEIQLNLALNRASEGNNWLVCRKDLKNQKNNHREKDNLVLRVKLLKDSIHPGAFNVESDLLTDGHLYLDYQGNLNRISGYLKHEGNLQTIDEVFFVGCGMAKITTINSQFRFYPNNKYDLFLDSEYARKRWQMTIKALGLMTWKRLCNLKIMIIGAGRSGEKMFLELAKLGVGYIVICDPDILEFGNLGEMQLATDKDNGRYKAEVSVEKVSEIRRTAEVTDCFNFRGVKGYNYESGEAQKAMQECDIIICCVDSDGGRSFASFFAKKFHKVLLDIGTGILMIDNKRVEGYDVRLILPGDGCLECCGGLNKEMAKVEIFNHRKRNQLRLEGHLHREGSLSYLNQMAVAKAVELLQDLCKGTIKNSTWVQFEKGKGESVRFPIQRKKDAECDCEK